MRSVDEMMNKGIAQGVFPGAVLLVLKNGSPVFHRAYGKADLFSGQEVNPATVFDLASLTKPLATTLALVKLSQENQIDPDGPLKRILPGFDFGLKQTVTPRLLLCHRSGLPAYQPYYLKLKNLSQTLWRQRLDIMVDQEPVVHGVNKKTVYSDIGFMVLARMVELVSDAAFDAFVYHHIYQPLKIDDLFFIRHFEKEDTPKGFAATEFCPWRGKLLKGAVHDDNAWLKGGVDGHAGLFGTAQGVGRLLNAIMAAYHGVSQTSVLHTDTLQDFLTVRALADRPAGFDVPLFQGSSAGRFFSKNTIGHLGFTGASFWLDLNQQISVILLTNRVHPFRWNFKIRKFRPALHDLIMESREIAENKKYFT